VRIFLLTVLDEGRVKLEQQLSRLQTFEASAKLLEGQCAEQQAALARAEAVAASQTAQAEARVDAERIKMPVGPPIVNLRLHVCGEHECSTELLVSQLLCECGLIALWGPPFTTLVGSFCGGPSFTARDICRIHDRCYRSRTQRAADSSPTHLRWNIPLEVEHPTQDDASHSR
jgi:hypothetical protein